MASENAIAPASLAQLVEHALRKRMVRGSIPLGGLCLLGFCKVLSTQLETATEHVRAEPHTIANRD